MRGKWILLLFVFVIVVVASVACTGLAGEPEIVSTIPVRSTSRPPVFETFDQLVSLEDGARIYAENCVRCHGISGAGDGELVLNGQIENIPDFTDPFTIQDLSLQEWFETITNGRLDALMPPWKDALSAEERWAVALYTYTLAYNGTALERGQEVYETQCADCHAFDGSGTENGSSLQGLVTFTEHNLLDTLVAHSSDLQLPTTTDDDLIAVVKYMWLLSSERRELPEPNLIVVAPQATEEVEDDVPESAPVAIPEAIGILRGRIIQGTEGGEDVEGLEAVLHIYDSQLREQIAEYIVGADGSYQYEEVVIRPDFAYRMTADYKGITYSSGIYIGDPNETEIVIDVTIYEPGADESALEITSRATQINLSSQGLYIIEVIDLINRSDRAYYRDNVAGASEAVSVGFALPEPAQLQLDHTDPNRILLSDDELTVLDMSPVLPNSEHYVQYSYLLPIEDAREILQPVDYQVSGPIAFFVENSHLDFVADNVELVETRLFNNQEYNVYEVSQRPPVGEAISYDVVLRTSPQTGWANEQTVPREVLALLLLVAGFILIGSAMFIVLRNRQPLSPTTTDDNMTTELIMQQIAELDNEFEAGSIEKAVYQKQRNELKKRLMQAMKVQATD